MLESDLRIRGGDERRLLEDFQIFWTFEEIALDRNSKTISHELEWTKIEPAAAVRRQSWPVIYEQR